MCSRFPVYVRCQQYWGWKDLNPLRTTQGQVLSTKRGNKGQGLRDKNLRQRMREKGKKRERGQGELSWGTKNCLWIQRRQMWPIHKWWFIKLRGKTRVRMRSLILIGQVNQVSQKELLVSGLQYCDSWTLVVSLRRKKWPNKGTGLGG